MPTEWPHLLADLKAKRDGLNHIITILETTFALPDLNGTPAVRVDGELPPRKYTRRAAAPVRRAKKAVKRTNERTNERATRMPRVSAARSLPDRAEAELTAIHQALQKRSPQRPKDLCQAVSLSIFTLRKRLAVLSKRGLATVTGATFSRQVHLGKVIGKAAATTVSSEPTESNGSVKRAADLKARSAAAPSTSPLDVVEARDREVLELIQYARGGRTLRELNISRPGDTPAALEASLTRLRVKKLIESDDNGRWTAA